MLILLPCRASRRLLRLGSGLAGAVHTAAGTELEDYCEPFAPLELGKALLTPGFKLPNPWVIHVRAAHFQHHPDAAHLLKMGLNAVFQIDLMPSTIDDALSRVGQSLAAAYGRAALPAASPATPARGRTHLAWWARGGGGGG